MADVSGNMVVVKYGGDTDDAAELRRENHLLTELSRVNEAESKALHKEIERLRGALAKAERKVPMSTSHTQTYEPSDAEKKLAAYVEELKLLRAQAALDHKRIHDAETAANLAQHKLESVERERASLVQENQNWERRYAELAGSLDEYKAQMQSDQAGVALIRQQLEAAKAQNSSLEKEDWREFWERKATQGMSRDDTEAAAAAAGMVVAVAAVATRVWKSPLMTSLQYNRFPAFREVRAAALEVLAPAALCVAALATVAPCGVAAGVSPIPTAFLPAFQTIRQLRQQKLQDEEHRRPVGAMRPPVPAHVGGSRSPPGGGVSERPPGPCEAEDRRQSGALHTIDELPQQLDLLLAFKASASTPSSRPTSAAQRSSVTHL